MDARSAEPKPIAVTIPTARRISGLGNSTIWKLISEGRLDTVSVGRRRLILYDSLEKLLSPKATHGVSP
jgi:excisionase family DNA binding protein